MSFERGLISYSYDLNDNVLSVHDNIHNLTHTKTYDNHNRVLKDSLGTGVEISYAYDALDRVTGLATCGHDVRYEYQSGRLKNVVFVSAKSSYTHSYNAFDLCGNVTQSSLIASCGTLTQTWDPLNRLEKISSEHFEETSSNFDAEGNLLKTTQRDPQGSFSSTFSYDDLYQLVEEKGVIDASYKNDSLHNRLSKNNSSYTINSLNQLLSDNETAYEYDKNGNPIVVGSMRLTYDALDRLIVLERPGYSRTLYTYDESHRRISKTTYLFREGDWVEEERFHFLFFNKREIGSINAQGTLSEFRVLGLGKGAELGASIALELNGKTFCPVHDHRGNITLLIDTNTRQPTDTYRYSAFGEETAFGSTLNPWRFASKRVDLESGFSFFGRRYYSPTVGRFLTPDPIGFADGPNLYAYVHNSPMILVDPYGLSAANIEGPSAGNTSTYFWNPGSNGSDNSFWHSSDNTSSFSEGPSGDFGNTGATSQCDSGGLLSSLYDFTIGLGWRIFAPEEALFSENDNHKKSNARVFGEYIGTGIGILSYAMPFFLPAKAIVTGVRVSSSAARGSISLMRAEKTISVIAKESSLATRAEQECKVVSRALGSRGKGARFAEISSDLQKGGSSGRLRPDPRAEGSHSSFRRNQSTGKINHYETYQPQTNPRNPNKWEIVVRYDGPESREHWNNSLKQDVFSPHIHDPLFPGGVRPALPSEIPKGGL